MTNTTLTLLSYERIASFYKAGFWRDETIYQASARHAATRPDAFAMQDRSRRVTYRALVRAADALAADLALHGVRAGHRVGVWLSSRVETAIALLACSRNGYACCPSLHRDHMANDVLELMRSVGAVAFIGERGYGADGAKSNIFADMAGLESMRRIVQLDKVGETGGEETLADRVALEPASLQPSNDPNRLVYLAFTSGTTGKPKGVMHSDNTLLANGREIAKDWSFGTSSVIYTMSPLSHNLGLGAMVSALSCGAELVVHDLPRGASLLTRLTDTGATFLFGVPTHAIDLLAELRASGVNKMTALTGFRISGAPVPQSVVAELMAYGVTPQSGYGMTEACSHHYTLPDDAPHRIIESSGRACASYEVKIWSNEDQDVELAAGEVGQIGGRGASLMLGYFDNQKATEESFNSHGWFMTGDVGRMDDEGYLVITGRKKDLIIRGGHNIYPARIENLAMQHKAIARAAALPVADERLGEKVCLAVMLRPDQIVEPAELLAHLDAAGLSKFDMPEFYLELADIPLTASGKIYKRPLLEKLKAGTLQPRPVRWQATLQA